MNLGELKTIDIEVIIFWSYFINDMDYVSHKVFQQFVLISYNLRWWRKISWLSKNKYAVSRF